MLYLIIGLALFLVPHSVMIFAPQWRKEKIASAGAGSYAGVHSILSAVGFGLIIWGYGQTRFNPAFIWHPPAAMNNIAALLVLVAFIVLAAAYVPRNHIKKAIGHPMVLSVKIWALAHLLANGRPGDILLFGVFLAWAIVLFIALRKEDRKNPPEPVVATVSGTLVAVAAGTAIWLVFALWLHVRLIGVAPFGA